MKPYLLPQLNRYKKAIEDATQCQPRLALSLAARVLARRLLLSQAIAAARLTQMLTRNQAAARRNPSHYTTA